MYSFNIHYKYSINSGGLIFRYEPLNEDNLLTSRWNSYKFFKIAAKVRVRHLIVQDEELRDVNSASKHVLHDAVDSKLQIVIAPLDVVERDLREHQRIQFTLQKQPNASDFSSLNVRLEYRARVDTQTLDSYCTKNRKRCAYSQMKVRQNTSLV
jgi:hypothetical protein